MCLGNKTHKFQLDLIIKRLSKRQSFIFKKIMHYIRIFKAILISYA